MEKIITYSFSENFINNLSQYIRDNFYLRDTDLSQLAIVFGGKRPALFLKRSLGGKFQDSFISPKFFSIDEFMHYVVSKKKNITNIQVIEACFIIYSLAKSKLPEILKSRERFSEFLPWAREIMSFIDQLDLENISKDRLKNIEENAEIGFEVPQSINKLLENIVTLRELYHAKMQNENKISRGCLYLTASQVCDEVKLDEFKQILFCNFFDLHQTEKLVIKHYFDQDKATLFFQNNKKNWPQFKKLSTLFGQEIKVHQENIEHSASPHIELYAGFDVHSQVGIVREVLKKIKNKNDTVIVLPQPDNIIPLLSEISSCAQDFNVSMGYPLCRSTIYGLFNAINRAQKTRKNGDYYSRDYLGVIKHPLLKNLKILENPAITRILVHKIEELLSGLEESELGGSLFLKLKSVEMLDPLYKIVQDQLNGMGIAAAIEDLKQALVHLHRFAFVMWESVKTLDEFSRALDEFQDELIKNSQIRTYPLNIKILNRIYLLADEFRNRTIKDEKFYQLEIFKIFDEFLNAEKIAFSGTPLKGLQILGLFETRALSFENVIIMDVNESILPRLSASEPLVPRAVMIGLGLDRLEEEESIQRYQFMRLIHSAKNVHLVYNDNPDMEKSRFIEEIIWEEEKRAKAMKVVRPPQATFKVEVMQKKGSVQKNNNIKKLLEDFTFSASSVNVYLKCPLQFYYRYILKLEEKEDLLDELESREVGTFIHGFLEQSFKQFLNKEVKINAAFEKKFFMEFEKHFKMNFSKRMKSDAFMLEQIMRYRLQKFLNHEKQRKVKTIVGLEHDIIKEILLGKRKVTFKCRIDRIDRTDLDMIQVLDYKTGSSDSVPRSLKNLKKAFENPDRSIIKKAVQSFQLPLYLYCIQEEYPGQKVFAALYNLRTLKFHEFPKIKELEHKNEIMKLSLGMLQFIIDEIYNLKIPFQADESEDSCRYCPFSGLCR